MAVRPVLLDVQREMQTLRYRTWKLTHPVDHKKIELEMNGYRRPLSGDTYARLLIEAIRTVVPPAVTPPPPSSVAAIWKADAVWTRALSSFSGEERAAARAAGFSVVYVHLDGTAHAAANEQEIAVFVREGWTIVGWAVYGFNTDPYEDGKRQAAISRRLPVLRGWKANGEAWAEGPDIGDTEKWLRGWSDGGGQVQVGWSVLSSETAGHVREFDYATALSVPGADIDFQVYGATHQNYTVGACLAHAKVAKIPADRITMSFDVRDDSPGPEGTGPFDDYNTWSGPRRVWTGEDATVATFRAFALRPGVG
jgi:hypothetical protein